MDLVAILGVAVTTIGVIVTTIGVNYARKDHNKKKQASATQEERVLNAKSKVKKVLLGFCNDWKSYSKSNELYRNGDPEYIGFIVIGNRLMNHIDQFNLVSNEISDLPNAVPDKLMELVAQMRVMVGQSNLVNPEVWGREYPSSIVNQFDEFLTDIIEMYTNLDEICSIPKKPWWRRFW